MSTTTPPAVPYQAYKPKRHSRTASAVLAPNVPAPTLSRPASIVSNGHIPHSLSAQADIFDTEKDSTAYSALVSVMHDKQPFLHLVPQPVKELPTPPSTDSSPVTPDTPHVVNEALDSVPAEPEPPVADKPLSINGESQQVGSTPMSPFTSPSSSSTPLPSVKESGSNGIPSKKTTTFRRLQPRPSAGRAPLPSSPLRPSQVQSRVPSSSPSITRQFDNSPPPPKSPPLHSRVASSSSNISDDKPHPAAQSTGPRAAYTPSSSVRISTPTLTVPQPVPGPGILQPSPRSSSMIVPPQPPPKHPKHASPASTNLSISPAASPPVSSPALSSVALRSSAPYVPGFQPKGFYRPRTDEFEEARKAKRDAKRVERTKLERRLEKLIHLHFPIEGSEQKDVRKAATERRRSSFFDLDFASLRNMEASDIWKGVVQSQAFQGTKGDIRAAEQRIAPWQEDSDVSKCPLCTASFHPITNRKHHCRLCGQIICSLPVKRGQRTEPCSILFIVDSKTRKIEEVGEGVDYGVKRKGSGTNNSKGNGKGKERDEALADDEKFLKGVRVCRHCKPILSREQFYQEVSRIPILLRLYEAFISLEKEIEEALPQFQELLLTLNSETAPTKEASAARKRILEDFASYDALSKRIRMLPCTPGSSQDRIQLAIRTRADLFLQKNMFPLQSIPKVKKQTSSPSGSDSATPLVDPDSELAHALQPLLEQEALIESFIGEAMAHRKFEDAKTLKANLKEIREEIDRMLENGAGGMKGTAQTAG